MARAPILAAGGIVVRGGARPLIAVVQRRKDNGWVLPKGKLKRKERPIAAARREVREETGQKVLVHEFLGIISYDVEGRLKIVQFWKMEAVDGPAGKLTRDIKAVEWLPLPAAVKRLSLPIERAFLRNVRRQAIKLDAGAHRKRRRTVRMDRNGRKLAAAAHGRTGARAPSAQLSRFRRIMASFWSEPAGGVAPSMPP
jgi:8-oxo-dGTP diphosphatase